MPTFYEFFCGGGMARAGLGSDWQCLFANDFDHKKCASYSRNWLNGELKKEDVRKLQISDLPGHADLAWASFPCQDLSLAGGGAGLKGDRSGTFWPFWDLIRGLKEEKRAPLIVALENVCGTLTSHGGRDFAAICSEFRTTGYQVGAVVVDAAYFLPQSRPRLFIIGVRNDIRILPELLDSTSNQLWHPRALLRAHEKLAPKDKENWLWWSIPAPTVRRPPLARMIKTGVGSTDWHSKSQTKQIIQMMDPTNRQKLRDAQALNKPVLGTMYRRTRPDRRGGTIQRVEVRFDGIAGCLRTPAGGSSRQMVIHVNGDDVRTRLLSTREAANLMGLPEDYLLPESYNEAYHLIGDGVAVPVVSFLSKHIFLPILANRQLEGIAA